MPLRDPLLNLGDKEGHVFPKGRQGGDIEQSHTGCRSSRRQDLRSMPQHSAGLLARRVT